MTKRFLICCSLAYSFIYLILVPTSIYAITTWTKSVQFKSLSPSLLVIQTQTFGDTLRYIYLYGTTPATSSDWLIYVIAGMAFLGVVWYFLGQGV